LFLSQLLPSAGIHVLFYVMLPHPPSSTLFPYTTLFRSFFFASSVRVAVERPNDFKAFLFKAAIGEQGESEVAGSNENDRLQAGGDRKSTRLNSSHLVISYAVFCLKKKNKVTNGPKTSFC